MPSDVISSKTKLPLGMVAAFLAAVIPLAGAAYVGRQDVADLKAEVKDIKSHQAKSDAGMSEIKQDIRAMQEGQKFQTQLLQEIRAEQREARRSR